MANGSVRSLLIIIGTPLTDIAKKESILSICTGLNGFCDASMDLSEELHCMLNSNDFQQIDDGHKQQESENLNIEVLFSPTVDKLSVIFKSFLAIPYEYRQIIYAGQYSMNSGCWFLSDGTFGVKEFNSCRPKEKDGSSVIYVNPINSFKCISKSAIAKMFTFKEAEVHKMYCDVVNEFMSRIDTMVNCFNPLVSLQDSNFTGNMTFDRPSIYIFPAGSGECSLFGVTGFNFLINTGYQLQSCFWNFIRHCAKIDCLAITHCSDNNFFGLQSLVKKIDEFKRPEISYCLTNIVNGKGSQSPAGDATNLYNIMDESKTLIGQLKSNGTPISPLQLKSSKIISTNLYNKIGVGSLDIYPISGAARLAGKNDVNNSSMSFLLVWTATGQKPTRILVPGDLSQTKLFEGLECFKSLEIIQPKSVPTKLIKKEPLKESKKLVKVDLSKPSTKKSVLTKTKTNSKTLDNTKVSTLPPKARSKLVSENIKLSSSKIGTKSEVKPRTKTTKVAESPKKNLEVKTKLNNSSSRLSIGSKSKTTLNSPLNKSARKSTVNSKTALLDKEKINVKKTKKIDNSKNISVVKDSKKTIVKSKSIEKETKTDTDISVITTNSIPAKTDSISVLTDSIPTTTDTIIDNNSEIQLPDILVNKNISNDNLPDEICNNGIDEIPLHNDSNNDANITSCHEKVLILDDEVSPILEDCQSKNPEQDIIVCDDVSKVEEINVHSLEDDKYVHEEEENNVHTLEDDKYVHEEEDSNVHALEDEKYVHEIEDNNVHEVEEDNNVHEVEEDKNVHEVNHLEGMSDSNNVVNEINDDYDDRVLVLDHEVVNSSLEDIRKNEEQESNVSDENNHQHMPENVNHLEYNNKPSSQLNGDFDNENEQFMSAQLQSPCHLDTDVSYQSVQSTDSDNISPLVVDLNGEGDIENCRDGVFNVENGNPIDSRDIGINCGEYAQHSVIDKEDDLINRQSSVDSMDDYNDEQESVHDEYIRRNNITETSLEQGLEEKDLELNSELKDSTCEQDNLELIDITTELSDSISEPREISPLSRDPIFEDKELCPELKDPISEDKELCPELRDPITEDKELRDPLSQYKELSPELRDSLSEDKELRDPISEDEELYPELRDPISEDKELRDPLSQDKELSPELKDPLSDDKELSPKLRDPISEDKELIPELRDSLSEDKEVSPELRDSLSEDTELSPELRDPLSEDKELCPELRDFPNENCNQSNSDYNQMDLIIKAAEIHNNDPEQEVIDTDQILFEENVKQEEEAMIRAHALMTRSEQHCLNAPEAIVEEDISHNETNGITPDLVAAIDHLRDPLQDNPLNLPTTANISQSMDHSKLKRSTLTKSIIPKSKLSPICVDMTFIPCHGDMKQMNSEFFTKIRARYYVLSSLNPSVELFDTLLAAKKTWPQNTEVTVIPTYINDSINYWFAENKDEVDKYKISISSPASNCIVGLNTDNVAAYRVEF